MSSNHLVNQSIIPCIPFSQIYNDHFGFYHAVFLQATHGLRIASIIAQNIFAHVKIMHYYKDIICDKFIALVWAIF